MVYKGIEISFDYEYDTGSQDCWLKLPHGPQYYRRHSARYIFLGTTGRLPYNHQFSMEVGDEPKGGNYEILLSKAKAYIDKYYEEFSPFIDGGEQSKENAQDQISVEDFCEEHDGEYIHFYESFESRLLTDKTYWSLFCGDEIVLEKDINRWMLRGAVEEKSLTPSFLRIVHLFMEEDAAKKYAVDNKIEGRPLEIHFPHDESAYKGKTLSAWEILKRMADRREYDDMVYLAYQIHHKDKSVVLLVREDYGREFVREKLQSGYPWHSFDVSSSAIFKTDQVPLKDDREALIEELESLQQQRRSLRLFQLAEKRRLDSMIAEVQQKIKDV